MGRTYVFCEKQVCTRKYWTNADSALKYTVHEETILHSALKHTVHKETILHCAYLHYLLQARALLYVKKNGPLSKMDPNGPGKRDLSEKKQQLIRKRVLEGSAQSVPDSGQLS